jgi:hypothetical protein
MDGLFPVCKKLEHLLYVLGGTRSCMWAIVVHGTSGNERRRRGHIRGGESNRLCPSLALAETAQLLVTS